MNTVELATLFISNQQKQLASSTVNTVPLLEKLTPAEEKEASTWERDPKAVAATDHFFGKGNDEISEPLSGTVDKSEIHKAVERHIGQNIESDDYRAGQTTDKYGRKVKIGGILTKSKAPSQLINGFANDSTRQGKKQTGLSVRITRSGAGIRNQTAPEQSWENSSCKNVHTGINRHYLQQETKHGTVVAYLHNHKGEEIARATLQPHINNEGHTAYAVDSHYGIDHAGFKQHVENLSKRLSGEHKGGSLLYTKHPEVYNDNGKSIMLHPNATKDDLNKALDDKNWNVRMAAAEHPNATNEHIDKALDDKDHYVREAAAKNPNANENHINKALDDKDDNVRLAAAKHPNASEKNINKALDDKDDNVRGAAAEHPKATNEHIDKALNDGESDVRIAAAKNPNANENHINKALDDSDRHVRAAAIRNQNVTNEHINKALDDKNWNVRMAATKHEKATKENLNKALDDKDYDVRARAAGHPNATSENIDKALNDKDVVVRTTAIANPNVNKKHIDKALDDKHHEVRMAAASHPNATKEHLDKALNDEDGYVRQAAARHKNADKEHLDKAMKDTDPEVRRIAAEKMLDKLGEKKTMNESFNFTQSLDEKINPFDIGRSHRDVTKHMKKIGYVLHRDRGDHEVYKHPNSPHTIAVPRHKDISPGVIRQIMAHIKTVQESVDESNRGLWYNIRKRREAGKRMRKPGEPGAPTAEAIRNSQKKEEYSTLDIIKRVISESAAWQRKEGKNPEGGLNRAGVASYRREHPGSKLQTAVTTKPSKLKRGSKRWKRRKSFCARMSGMRGAMKDKHGRPTRKALSLKKWNC